MGGLRYATSTDASFKAMSQTELPPRMTKRRPIRNMGEPSRHVWGEMESVPVLIFNFYAGESSEVFGDLSGVSVETEADIFLEKDEVGRLKAQLPEESKSVEDRIKLNNSWQRADIATEVTSGWMAQNPVMKVTIDWGAANAHCGFLKMMPHLGYACAVGMRVEFRQPAYQVHVQKTTLCAPSRAPSDLRPLPAMQPPPVRPLPAIQPPPVRPCERLQRRSHI